MQIATGEVRNLQLIFQKPIYVCRASGRAGFEINTILHFIRGVHWVKRSATHSVPRSVISWSSGVLKTRDCGKGLLGMVIGTPSLQARWGSDASHGLEKPPSLLWYLSCWKVTSFHSLPRGQARPARTLWRQEYSAFFNLFRFSSFTRAHDSWQGQRDYRLLWHRREPWRNKTPAQLLPGQKRPLQGSVRGGTSHILRRSMFLPVEKFQISSCHEARNLGLADRWI